MTHLSLRLLGGFQAKLDGAPASGFHTQKARALLAYLAVEASRPHARPHLAGLLWPTWPDVTARTYLRQTIANLRDVLADRTPSPPFLLISRQALQLNPQSDYWTDVTAVTEALASLPSDPSAALAPDAVSHLQQAVDLYQGCFLEGFFLKGCSAFEEWQLLTSESIERQVVAALSFLTQWRETRGECVEAIRYAWRHAELEPLSDAANRRIIRLLALESDPGAALAHYERYRHLLAHELETTPTPATVDLAARIRSGRFLDKVRPDKQAPHRPMSLPPFLPERKRVRPSGPFVARERELTQLHGYLGEALHGNGQVAFITGHAGQGKTVLLHEFVRQAVANRDDLLAVGGRCSNYRGVGDPYHPFRTIFTQLSGDFVGQWEAGVIGRDLARRLWANAPFAVDVLLTQGPDLIDILIPAIALREQAAAMPGGAALVERLSALARPHGDNVLQSSAIFDQCTRVLHAVARKQPLILWLDDLHWGDLGSLALLLHLGQRLSGCRLLIVGAYRPEEMALNRPGARHPLERLILEFRQRYGQMTVDLNRADGRAFVEAYVDIEPNRLGREFRDALFMVSDGHPLFTVELLKNMQAGGGLVRDEAGRWVQGQALDWHALPPRVEAAIGQRMERLPLALRLLLEAAAIQGVEFTAEMLAAALGLEVRDVVRTLGAELERRYDLIVALGLQRVGEQRLAHYRFRHSLFRDYLLEHLDHVEQLRLHEAMAGALETLYAVSPADLSAVAGQLALHYQEADLPAKAVPYLVEAGNRALRMSAYDEALARFQQGLALLDQLPETPEHRQQRLQLLIGLGTVQGMVHGHASPEVEKVWEAARPLARQAGNVQDRFRVLWYMWELRFQRGEMRAALALAEECLALAGDDPRLSLAARLAVAPTLYRLGKMMPAHRHFTEARSIHATLQDRRRLRHFGEDAGVNAYVNGSLVLWYLGFPDRARAMNAEGLAAARALDHPFSLAFALIFAAALYQRVAIARETEAYARQVIELMDEHGFALWSAVAELYCGWARVAQGDEQAGLQQARRGLDAIRKTGMEHIRYEAVLADVHRLCGQVGEGLTTVERLLATVARTDEREWEAELHRLRGELLLMQGRASPGEVQHCFMQAIAVAREQEAKSLELRAAISLARLRRADGDGAREKEPLATLYGWFSEGFDTPDLVVASDLLAQIRDKSP